MFLHASRRLHLRVALLLALALAACEGADSGIGSKGFEAQSADTTTSADTSGWSSGKDAAADISASWSYDTVSGSDATSGWADTPFNSGGGGQPTKDDDMGIGLKPGGAQDIAFFRQKLAGGTVPKPTDMTLSGWLNEHDTVLPAALPDRLVTLHAQAAVHQDVAGKQDVVVQLGLNSAKSLDTVQAKLGLVVVVDTSGSMAGDKMAYMLDGLHELVKNVPANTQLGIVRFSSDATVSAAVTAVSTTTAPALHAAIDQLYADGGTNLHGGLAQGKALCSDITGAEVKRILLLSDGQPSAGNTEPGAMIQLAKSAAAAGCSVSTVGVGADFAPQLMTAIAEQGQGTAWFLPDAASAKTVFVEDLATLLLPVAEKLSLGFELGQGWAVAAIPGFEWVQNGSQVQILGPKSEPLPGEPTEPDPTPGTDTPAPGTDEQTTLPTLFASKKNGLVMVELAAPAGDTWTLATLLAPGKVKYSYTEKKSKQVAAFEVPLAVPGLVDVPDGGLQYFGSAAVRRARLLLRDGQALMAACALYHAGDTAGATAGLTAALAFHDAEVVALQPDLAKVDLFQPDLADARKLLAALADAVAGQE